ncbi:MAG: ATP-dependent zinc metalloprotease FtsH [Provencibacterium sp.]|nr:ATP-dependent zinc metalloprotease FtsH [Provencibacterium sp.]
MALEVRLKPSELTEYLASPSVQQAVPGGDLWSGILGGESGKIGETVITSDAVQSYQLNYRLPSIVKFLEHVDPLEYQKAYDAANPEAPLEWNWKPPKETSIFTMLLPYLLLIGAMAIFYFIMMRQAGGGGGKMMSFSKAKVKSPDEGRRVTFSDVAGADEEKAELVEIVEFLKNPGKYNSLGARIPKGVLLMGPPGTGKTLLARAVAGEAGVPFFSISGSDFVEMFVGVGASRVRDLFESAKKNAPSIIFIDEIDAVGRHRGAGLGGGHDEREQTLNQLLVEMDGFGANTGVIVMAATNRRDILDPALLRPGRFDRQITVGYPDVKGREEILRVHSRNKPIGPDVDLRTIAKTTVGFTGADLENLMNEAALLAARANRKAITMPDIEKATIKVVAGPEKRSHVVTEKDKRLTAFHEAGHAITTYYCETQSKVHEVSIIPRGMAGGYTLSLPEEDRSYHTKREMEEEIATLLAGRMAEKLVLDDISTGASNDIERATKIARGMVTRYGFSEKLGPIVYGQDEGEVFLGRDFNHTRNYSENVAAAIDEEIRRIVDNGYEKAEKILTEHMDQLERVANFLFEYEKVDAEGFERLMKGDESVYADYQHRREEREEEEKRIAREREEENRLREQKKKAQEEYRRQQRMRMNNPYLDENPPHSADAPLPPNVEDFYPPVQTGPIKDLEEKPKKEAPSDETDDTPKDGRD